MTIKTNPVFLSWSRRVNSLFSIVLRMVFSLLFASFSCFMHAYKMHCKNKTKKKHICFIRHISTVFTAWPRWKMVAPALTECIQWAAAWMINLLWVVWIWFSLTWYKALKKQKYLIQLSLLFRKYGWLFYMFFRPGDLCGHAWTYKLSSSYSTVCM